MKVASAILSAILGIVIITYGVRHYLYICLIGVKMKKRTKIFNELQTYQLACQQGWRYHAKFKRQRHLLRRN
jgi:hypothetical protein